MKRVVIQLFFALLIFQVVQPTVVCAKENKVLTDKEKYKKYRQKGDVLKSKKKYLEAVATYKIALTHKEGDKYVLGKIKECEAELFKVYKSLVDQADKKAAEGKCAKAIILYDSALIYKPNDEYVLNNKDKCDEKVGGNTFKKTVTSPGTINEVFFSIPANDGGYYVGGKHFTTSGHSYGSIIHLGKNGEKKWGNKVGTRKTEEAHDLIQTKSGDLVMVGQLDMDENQSGSKVDMWVVKLSNNGQVKWSKNFGEESSIDIANAVIETKKGNYLVVGNTLPLGGDSPNADVVLLMLDPSGNKVWEKKIGGERNEEGVDIVRDGDGFVILSNQENPTKAKIQWDALLTKVDASGSKVWEKKHGGLDSDKGNDLVRLKSGGFAIAGYTYSFEKFGGHDSWVLVTNAQGVMKWQSVFGDKSDDQAFSVVENTQGELIMAGYTTEYIGEGDNAKIGPNGDEILLVRLTAGGKKVWERKIGGVGNQKGRVLIQNAEGGYLLGSTHNKSGQSSVVVYKLNRAGKE